MLQVPSEVLDLPLVRSGLPATPYRLGDVFGANDVLANGRRVQAWQTPGKQLPRLLGRHSLIRRASHYRADPT